MQYNNHFRLQDLFCNKKLGSIIPQFDRYDITSGEPSDYKIYKRCRNMINGFLGGVLTEQGIEVTNKSTATVLRLVTACKSVLEAMFNNSKSLMQNIKENKRVYTSIASISQLEEMTDPQKKLKILNQILDNINYNPDFKSQNNVPSNSARPYEERQKLWEKRVGYKRLKKV